MAQYTAGTVVLLAWASNSFLQPPSKRAAALGLINMFSNIGIFIGS
jgi:hypothetical protein